MTSTLLRTTSVTRELDCKDSPLRALLRPHQPLLDQWRKTMIRSLSGKPWIRPARTRLAWMTGHAIDYRARWWLTGVTDLPDAVVAGLGHCSESTRSELLEAFAAIAGSCGGVLAEDLERAVCSVAAAAASVEPLYRAGAVPCALADLGLAAFSAEYTDVVALSAGLRALFADFAGREIVTGPVVGIGRLGGDADLIAGGELVEIKCVVDPRASATRAVQQLFVYAARLQPNAASLVLPRQHTRVVFDLGRHHVALENLNIAIENEYG
jgi:hypothetical protein